MAKKRQTKTPITWNEWEPGQYRGGQHQLDRPIPPMRDNAGRPMIDRDHVDWARVIREQNRRDGIED